MRVPLAAVSVALAVTIAPSVARAQELRYDLAVDLPIAIGGAGAWVTSELLKKDLSPSSCRWCDRDADGTDRLNGLDRGVRDGLKWNDTKTADTISNVTGFALTPLLAIGAGALAAAHDDRQRGIGVDVLVVAEAAVIAVDLNQLTKFLVGRERPFVHALPPDQKGLTAQPSDNNVSFFSGHTTATMSVAVAAGTVASMRGYRWAPLVWATGLTLSLTTAYLRIGADKHYFTDVMTGAIVGAAIGFGVPYLFHRPRNDVAPGTSTGAVSVGMTSPGVVGFSGVW